MDNDFTRWFRVAKQQGGHGIMGAIITNGIQVKDSHVAGFSRNQAADIFSSQTAGAAEGAHFQNFIHGHSCGAMDDPVKKQCLAQFSQQVAAVVAC